MLYFWWTNYRVTRGQPEAATCPQEVSVKFYEVHRVQPLDLWLVRIGLHHLRYIMFLNHMVHQINLKFIVKRFGGWDHQQSQPVDGPLNMVTYHRNQPQHKM